MGSEMRQMVEVEEAQQLLLDRVVRVKQEEVALNDALGRVLAMEVLAPLDLPPFDRALMDGYSLRAADTIGAIREQPATLSINEEVPAGHVAKGRVERGTAVRIFTGAPIPPGADCVVRMEDADQCSNWVIIYSPVTPGQFISRAGDDIQAGEKLLAPGIRLSPAEIGLLAALGLARVKVFCRPRIGLISTGDELAPLGSSLLPGKIYDSNLYTFAAAITEAGGEPVVYGTVPDRAELLQPKLAEALANCDLVLTTGGVSVGDYDIVAAAYRQSGAEILFWKIAGKPGTPVLAAEKDGKLLGGLSGNPTGASVAFDLLIRPVIRKMSGLSAVFQPRVRVMLDNHFKHTGNQRRFLRARIYADGSKLRAVLTGRSTPGTLRHMLESNALVEVPAGHGNVNEGYELEAIIIR